MYPLDLWFLTLPFLLPAQDFSLWTVSSRMPLCIEVSLGSAAMRMLESGSFPHWWTWLFVICER